MKRFDKKKNIRLVNTKLNENWLKSKGDILTEGDTSDLIKEETYNDLYEFLNQGFRKMTNGTAYYVSSMDSSMNKNIIDSETGEKVPNPMYGKIYKHTRFMFPWLDTFSRAKERKGLGSEVGQRSGEFEKVEGYDMIEKGKNGLYLPILPTGSEYKYAIMEGDDFVEIDKDEVKKYLRPSGASTSGAPAFRLLLVNNIAKLTGGGNIWVNPDFGFKYIGPGTV